uniref:AXH domain-containing protein n=1 Tax=Ditylenchus dipsaci TaxID=166011 RepID=A0A915CV51_9BILA
MDTGAVRSLKLQPCRKTLKIEVEKEDSVGMSKGEFQCPVEYPLFCTNDSKGWTSFDPRKTLNLYGLECKQLQVEDTFILLADHQQ